MKKIFTLSITIGLLSSLLFSCGSSLTVTKRHYNKGYHISYNKVPKSANPSNEENLVINKEETSSFSISNVQERKTSTADTKSTDIPMDKISDENISEKETESKSALVDNPKNGMFDRETYSSELEESKLVTNSDESSLQNSPHRSDDGLSMVWIIILVVLILWALGFGFFPGIGSLIHLLLVIALILLILWLLGVI